MHQAAVNAIIKHTCIQCSCPEMAVRGRISVGFSNRLTSSLALASYSHVNKVGEITLSSVFWHRLTASQQAELIIHEVCHVLTDYLFGDTKPHGYEWKMLMRCAGIVKPSACLEMEAEI